MADVVKENVQFVGLDTLDPLDQQRVRKVIYTSFEKLEREFKQITSLRVHFKQYEKQGNKKKYSLTLLIDAASRPVSTSLKQDTGTWDPVAAIHKVMDKARATLAHKFGGDSTHPPKTTKQELGELR